MYVQQKIQIAIMKNNYPLYCIIRIDITYRSR